VQSNGSLNDSLILFTGQKGQTGMGSDHLSLGLLKGRVIFVFNFGSGPGMLISQTSLTSGNDLHTVIFGHNNTEGFLQVNSETGRPQSHWVLTPTSTLTLLCMWEEQIYNHPASQAKYHSLNNSLVVYMTSSINHCLILSGGSLGTQLVW